MFIEILENSASSPFMMLPFGGRVQHWRSRKNFRRLDSILYEAVDSGMKVLSCAV